MIIGNNNPIGKNNSFNNNNNNSIPNNFTQSFDKRFNMIKEAGEKNKNKVNILANDKQTYHSDVNSKKEMADKTFSMLQERYNNGLISLDEFNKKCNQLNKMRQKQ